MSESGPAISAGRSVMIMALVVGCFAVLWPRIFYPMLQASVRGNNPNLEQHEVSGNEKPKWMAANMKDALRVEAKRAALRSERPFPMHQSGIKSERKTQNGGVMGFFMPFYSIAILLFFVYTLMKYMTKSSGGEEPEEESFESNKARFNKFDQDIQWSEDLKNMPNDRRNCLKRLAANYARCKGKLNGNIMSNKRCRDDISQAIKILLHDLVELRAYTLEKRRQQQLEHLAKDDSEEEEELKEAVDERKKQAEDQDETEDQSKKDLQTEEENESQSEEITEDVEYTESERATSDEVDEDEDGGDEHSSLDSLELENSQADCEPNAEPKYEDNSETSSQYNLSDIEE